MSLHKWNPRILIRYALLQLLELILFIIALWVVERWVMLPVWLLWGAVVIWVIKDALLYPLVWQAYNPDQPEIVLLLVDAKGIAKERLEPSGYIRVGGALWKAELVEGCAPVAAGEAVRVNERHGLTLSVQPWDEGD